MFCEQCGAKLYEGVKFCGECGAKVGSAKTEAVANIGVQTTNKDTLLRTSKFNGYSCFIGEPVAVKKSTGTVRIYDNRVEYEKIVLISGSSAKDRLTGGAVAAKGESYEERVERYYYRNISGVKTRKYMGRHTLVITMRTGETIFLCCRMIGNKEPLELLNLVSQYINTQQNNIQSPATNSTVISSQDSGTLPAYCPQCGTKLGPGEVYCTICGNAL